MATAAAAAGNDWAHQGPGRIQSVTSLHVLPRSACVSPTRSELSTASRFPRTPSSRAHPHFSTAGPFCPAPRGPGPPPVRRWRPGEPLTKETVFHVQPLPNPRPQRPQSARGGFLRRSTSQNVLSSSPGGDSLSDSFRAAAASSPFRGAFTSPSLDPRGAPGAPVAPGAEDSSSGNGVGSGSGQQGRRFMVRSTSINVLQAAKGVLATAATGKGGEAAGTSRRDANTPTSDTNSNSNSTGGTGSTGGSAPTAGPGAGKLPGTFLGTPKPGEEGSVLRQGRGLLVRAATHLYKTRGAQPEGARTAPEGTPHPAPQPLEKAKDGEEAVGQASLWGGHTSQGGNGKRQIPRAHSIDQGMSRPGTAPARRPHQGQEAPGMPGAGVPGAGYRRRPVQGGEAPLGMPGVGPGRRQQQGEEAPRMPGGAPRGSPQVPSFGAPMKAMEAGEGAQGYGGMSRGREGEGRRARRAQGGSQANHAAGTSPMPGPSAEGAPMRSLGSSMEAETDSASASASEQGVLARPATAGARRQPVTAATAGARHQAGARQAPGWMRMMRGSGSQAKPVAEEVAEEGAEWARASLENSKDSTAPLQAQGETRGAADSISLWYNNSNNTQTNTSTASFNSINTKQSSDLNTMNNRGSSSSGGGGSNSRRVRPGHRDEPSRQRSSVAAAPPGATDSYGGSEAGSECMAITASSSNSSLVSVANSQGSSQGVPPSPGAGTPEAHPGRPQTSGGKRGEERRGPVLYDARALENKNISESGRGQGPEQKQEQQGQMLQVQVQVQGQKQGKGQGEGQEKGQGQEQQGPGKGQGKLGGANLRRMFQKVNFMAAKKKADAFPGSVEAPPQGGTVAPTAANTTGTPVEAPPGASTTASTKSSASGLEKATRGSVVDPTKGLSAPNSAVAHASRPARPATAHGRLWPPRTAPAAHQGFPWGAAGRASDAESALATARAVPKAPKIRASRTAHGPEDAQASAVAMALAANGNAPVVSPLLGSRSGAVLSARTRYAGELAKRGEDEEEEDQERSGETVAAAVLARAMANAALLKGEESRRRAAGQPEQGQEQGGQEGAAAGATQRARGLQPPGASAKGTSRQASQAASGGAQEAPAVHRKLWLGAEKLLKTLAASAQGQRTPPPAAAAAPQAAPNSQDPTAMAPLTLPHAAVAEQRARQRAQGVHQRVHQGQHQGTPGAPGGGHAPHRHRQQQARAEGEGGEAHWGHTRRNPGAISGSSSIRAGQQKQGEGERAGVGAEQAVYPQFPRGHRLVRSTTMHLQAKSMDRSMDREAAADDDGNQKKLVRAISVRLSQREAQEGAAPQGMAQPHSLANPGSSLGTPQGEAPAEAKLGYARSASHTGGSAGAEEVPVHGPAAWAARGVPSPETSGEEDGWVAGGGVGTSNPLFNAGMWSSGERPRRSRRHPKAKKRSAKAGGTHGTPGRSRDPSPTLGASDSAVGRSPPVHPVPGPHSLAYPPSPQGQEVVRVPGSPVQGFPPLAPNSVAAGTPRGSQGVTIPRGHVAQGEEERGRVTGGANGVPRKGHARMSLSGKTEGGGKEEDSEEAKGEEGTATNNRNLLSIQGLYRPTTPTGAGSGTPVESPRVHPAQPNPTLGAPNTRMPLAGHGPLGPQGYALHSPQGFQVQNMGYTLGGQAVSASGGVSASSPRGPRQDMTSVFHLVPLPLSSVNMGQAGLSPVLAGPGTPQGSVPWSQGKPPMTPRAGDAPPGSSSPFLNDAFEGGAPGVYPGVYQDASTSEDPSQSSGSSGASRTQGYTGGYTGGYAEGYNGGYAAQGGAPRAYHVQAQGAQPVEQASMGEGQMGLAGICVRGMGVVGGGGACAPLAQEYSVSSPVETSEDGMAPGFLRSSLAGPGYATRQVIVPVSPMRSGAGPAANPHMSPRTPRHAAGARHTQAGRSPRQGGPYDWESIWGEARGQIVPWTGEGGKAGPSGPATPSAPASLATFTVPEAASPAVAQAPVSETQMPTDGTSAAANTSASANASASAVASASVAASASASAALVASIGDEKTAQALKLVSELLLLASQPRPESAAGAPALSQAEQLRIAARLLMAASEGLQDSA